MLIKIFILKIFLLIIWEFHIMDPDHTHFLILPGLPPQLLCPHQKKKKKKSNLCCSYTHWSTVKHWVVSLLKNEFFPTLTHTRGHQL